MVFKSDGKNQQFKSKSQDLNFIIEKDRVKEGMHEEE